MNKKIKTIITLGVIILIGVAIFMYFKSMNVLAEGDNKDNNIVVGMNENNNIIKEENNIVVNNVIENNIVEDTIQNNIEENEIQNNTSENKNNIEKPSVSPNNESELESNNDEEKAIGIVKKDWGSTDGVYFKVQAIDANGNYVISVNNSETTASLAWYTVNPKTGEFTN